MQIWRYRKAYPLKYAIFSTFCAIFSIFYAILRIFSLNMLKYANFSAFSVIFGT